VDNDGPFLKDALAVPATHIKVNLDSTEMRVRGYAPEALNFN
jgi:hypothetical protein